MTTRQWQNITDYMDTVGTTLKTFTFPKTQNYVNVTIRGNANVTYTIGSQSGTLTPGQSIGVSEKITSFTLTAASGTQAVEVWATEDGTQKVEDDSSDSIAGLASSLAAKAKQTDLVYVNVKNPPSPLVGVKGDGVTDDTVAINNLFANSPNKNFYFPTGTYMVQYTNFSGDIRLLGDGFDLTIIKRLNNYTTDNFDTFHSEKGNVFGNANTSFATQSNVSIEGITFDGNVSSVTSTQVLANMFNNVQLTYLENLLIKNCQFINSIGDGLWISGSRNSVIESCYFNHCGYTTAPTGTYTRNNMSAFGKYNDSVGAHIVETNTTIRNCYFNDAHDMGIVTRNTKSLLIEDCEFTNIGIANLELYGDSLSNATSFNTFDTRIIIKGNEFQGGSITHDNSNKNYKEVFIFEDNLVNCPITSTSFQIIGNRSNFDLFLRNNTLIVPEVYVDNVNKCDIKGNDIQFNGGYGVHLSNSNYPVISENLVNNVLSSNTSAVGINLFGLNNEPCIENNAITGVIQSTREAIFFNYTDNTTIMIQSLRVIGNKIDMYNRGVNVSSAVNNSILVNSNIFDIPLTPDYCVNQWSGACKKAMAIGNVGINNTSISLSATTKNISNNV